MAMATKVCHIEAPAVALFVSHVGSDAPATFILNMDSRISSHTKHFKHFEDM